MEQTRRIDENIELRKMVSDLSKKALTLEKRGELQKAADIYEDLLIFPLPSYDREFIIGKLHNIWIDVELKRVKREENTRAIKYLDSARVLNREGNEEEALEYYQMLILECPNSDFIKDALDEMKKLASPVG
jgi:tetratricopeptide (TPR) repeat protein